MYSVHQLQYTVTLATVPITEDFPLSATNPYGRTKLMQEEIFRDFYVADKEWNILLLRYFNPIGAHKSGEIGEDPNGIPNNLMPYITKVATGELPRVNVFGNVIQHLTEQELEITSM